MKSGKELIALAGVLAIEISDNMNVDELISTIELLSLLKHNLEAIKISRIVNKIEDKKEEKV